MNCEFCGKEHDGSYGSGRFCCAKCARSYSNTFVTEEGIKKRLEALEKSPTHIKHKKNPRKKKPKKEITSIISKERKPVKKTVAEKKKERKPIKKKSRDQFKNTTDIGKLGEVATIKKFIENEVAVYTPISDSRGVDMVADFGGKLQKVQVKTTSTISESNSSRFKLSKTRARYKNGEHHHEVIKYNKDEVDYYSLYDYNHDRVFLLKNDGERSSVAIRYDEPLGNFSNTFHYADDYDIDRVLDLMRQSINPDSIIDI